MRVLAATAVTLALLAPAAPVHAAAVTTVKGEVVDLECAVTKGPAGKAQSHAACAMSCARTGAPMALLTPDALYLIDGSFTADGNAKLLDFVGRAVEAKGTITERDGKLHINVAAMMVQK